MTFAALALTACASIDTDSGCGPGADPVGDSVTALQEALDAAQPGDVLQLADTTYSGHFTITASGRGEEEITLCGSRGAVIDGGDSGYALHLDGASHWKLDGFGVVGGSKGIMLDASSSNVLTDLEVSHTGQEGIHLRSGSSGNSIVGSTVHHTGLTMPAYGEGIYIGTAQPNWCEYTECAPDASDHNVLLRNTVSETTAEAIDVKEGTSNGVISNNRLSIAADAQVDSVIDVKGNDWMLRANQVTASDAGIQIHRILEGWGLRNVLLANIFDVAADAYAIEVVGDARDGGNLVGCNNSTASGASILTNVACTESDD